MELEVVVGAMLAAKVIMVLGAVRFILFRLAMDKRYHSHE